MRVLFFLLSLASLAGAVGTSVWELSGRGELVKGEFIHTYLTSRGEVALGRTTQEVKTSQESLWSSVVAPDGTIWFGTGTGTVCRLAADKIETVYATKEMLVTSLVAGADGAIYAGTLPNGRVFRVDPKGEGKLLCQLPAAQVFALAADGKGGLYAGTGPGGKIYSIDPDGKSKEFYNTKRENVLCLWRDPNGDLYAGTSLAGTIFRISPEGRAWVLADLGETEVVSIVRCEAGTYAGVNSGNKTNPADFLKAMGEAAGKEVNPGPKPPADKKTVVASGLVVISPSGEVDQVLGFNDTYITCLAPWEKTEVLIGTNNSGKVWRVGPDMEFSVFFDLKEDQVLTLAQDASGVRAIGTGSPGAAHVIAKDPPKEASYTSDVVDAAFFTRWGRIEWRGRGKLSFRTRTGNSRDAEDGTWADWSEPITQFPGKVTSPPSRFLQVRAEWTDDPDAVLTGLSVSYLVQNQRPQIQEFTVEDVAPGADGRKTCQKKLKWKVSDADNDAVGINVYYRKVGMEGWVLVNRDAPLTGTEYTWATEALEDGKYQLRLEATDEQANTTDTAERIDRVTQPFVIDNSRPTLEVAIGADGKVTGSAEDAASFVQRIDYRIDGGPWKSVAAKDGMLDDPKEEFEIPLDALLPGRHLLTVRATGAGQNTVIVEREVGK